MLKLLRTALALCAFSAATAAAQTVPGPATTYPGKPVRMLVGYAPGGATDVIARALAQSLSKAWSQPVVVENKPGASGMLAAEQVVKAPPDGLTLLLAYTPEVSLNKLVFKDMRYDPATDLTAVSLTAYAPLLLVSGPGFPAKSVGDILAFKGRADRPLTYGSPGIGGQQHLAGELLALKSGVKMTHVPYRGTSMAVADLVGGQIDLFFATAPALLPHIRSGKLTPLGVAGKSRIDLFPAVPTLAEAGVPDMEITNWFGVFGPKGMPAPVTAKLAADVATALSTPEVRKQLEEQGLTIRAIAGQEFRGFIADEMTKYEQILKAIGPIN